MKQFPLHSQHQSLGAHFQIVGDWETPEHYGDSIQEHLAVRNGVGISDLSSRGKILVTGEDRVTWLQGIISNDILPLHPGQGLYSTFMNHKGKILAYFRVFMLEDSIFVEDVGEVNDTTYQQFRKFLLFGTKAKMENCLDRWGILLMAGPTACQVIENTFGIDILEVNPQQFENGPRATGVDYEEEIVSSGNLAMANQLFNQCQCSGREFVSRNDFINPKIFGLAPGLDLFMIGKGQIP